MERLFDCDPGKRARLLADRGLDLRGMGVVFHDLARLDIVDARFDYGEERRVTVGRIGATVFTVIYTMRGPVTWLITAWVANRKERERYGRD